jgi:PPOX class probable F420-dependent enzyme
VPVASNVETLPGWARDLLRSERVGRLGVLDGDGRPRVLPVTYAVVGDQVWSAVDEKPKRVPAERLARVRWLRARPDSSLTVDRYDDDWSRLAWVQLVGRTSIHRVEEHPEVVAALQERYSQYRDRPPRGPLLCLAPDRILHWRAAEGP